MLREINHIVNIKYTVIEKYETLEVNYQQISPSETSNFRYYFDLYIKNLNILLKLTYII